MGFEKSHSQAGNPSQRRQGRCLTALLRPHSSSASFLAKDRKQQLCVQGVGANGRGVEGETPGKHPVYFGIPMTIEEPKADASYGQVWQPDKRIIHGCRAQPGPVQLQMLGFSLFQAMPGPTSAGARRLARSLRRAKRPEVFGWPGLTQHRCPLWTGQFPATSPLDVPIGGASGYYFRPSSHSHAGNGKRHHRKMVSFNRCRSTPSDER